MTRSHSPGPPARRSWFAPARSRRASWSSLYLERIERLDPQLNAFRVVLAERALAEADEAERGRRPRATTRPLLGVPIALKDNHDLAGELTTHGTGCFDEPARGRLRDGPAAARRGRDRDRQDQPPGAGLRDVHRVARPGASPATPGTRSASPGGSCGGSGAAVAAGLAPRRPPPTAPARSASRPPTAALFGLKPQRGRVPLDPQAEHWHGMSVNGCLTPHRPRHRPAPRRHGRRRPRATEAPRRPSGRSPRPPETSPGKLRIAVSPKLARALAPPMLDERCRRALEETADLLRSLGHDVTRARSRLGQRRQPGLRPATCAASPTTPPRCPTPSGSASTRASSRGWAALIPDIAVRRARAATPKYAARINAIFDHCDVLLTPTIGEPPVPVGKWDSRRGLWTLAGMTRRTGFTPPWNYLGNPAAAVPAGFTRGGPAAVGAARRPPRRRGDAALARRPDRGRAALGRPSPARLLAPR